MQTNDNMRYILIRLAERMREKKQNNIISDNNYIHQTVTYKWKKEKKINRRYTYIYELFY
mgnify:CR=1 FL=1